MYKHLSFFLNLVAIGLFVPGILLPMFSLNMELQIQLAGGNIASELINKELSLIGTIEELWQDQRLLVAILIFMFSIAIPVIKSLLMLWAYLKKHTPIEKAIYRWLSIVGKWSMADVFVVAIFLAVLSTNHGQTQADEQLIIFGFKLNFLMSNETISQVGVGFYYFTAYCVVSLLASQFAQASLKKH